MGDVLSTPEVAVLSRLLQNTLVLFYQFHPAHGGYLGHEYLDQGFHLLLEVKEVVWLYLGLLLEALAVRLVEHFLGVVVDIQWLVVEFGGREGQEGVVEGGAGGEVAGVLGGEGGAGE